MRLLFGKPPLVVSPDLARLVGVNEAIVLHQIDYWLTKNEGKETHTREGYTWAYDTYQGWIDRDFPFLSMWQLRAAIRNLEAAGLLIARRFNQRAYDKTKWYRIDYAAVEQLEKHGEAADHVNRSRHHSRRTGSGEPGTGKASVDINRRSEAASKPDRTAKTPKASVDIAKASVDISRPIPETNSESTPEVRFPEKPAAAPPATALPSRSGPEPDAPPETPDTGQNARRAVAQYIRLQRDVYLSPPKHNEQTRGQVAGIIGGFLRTRRVTPEQLSAAIDRWFLADTGPGFRSARKRYRPPDAFAAWLMSEIESQAHWLSEEGCHAEV